MKKSVIFSVMEQSFRKILIIRFSSIGDILLTTPVIRALRKRFPDAEIDFLVKPEYVELLRFNPHLSSVLELGAAGSRDMFQIARDVKEERYDAVFDLQGNVRSWVIRSLSGARIKGKVNKRVRERFQLVRFGRNVYAGIVPVVTRYAETLAGTGAEIDDGPLEIHFPRTLGADVHRELDEFGLTSAFPVIGVAPAAKHATKMWPAERFSRLAVELSRRYNAQIALFGGKQDVRRCEGISHEVASHIGSERIVNLAGRFSLLGTAAAFDRCSLVVANDSGLMHLATARRKPVVAIFGPTVEEFGFFPYGAKSAVVEQKGLACRPCSHLGGPKCPKGHFRCMMDTTVDAVVAAAESLLPAGLGVG